MRMAVSHKYKELGEILLKVRMRYTLDSFFAFILDVFTCTKQT